MLLPLQSVQNIDQIRLPDATDYATGDGQTRLCGSARASKREHIAAVGARVRSASIETALVIELDVALADFDEAAPTAAAPGW